MKLRKLGFLGFNVDLDLFKGKNRKILPNVDLP